MNPRMKILCAAFALALVSLRIMADEHHEPSSHFEATEVSHFGIHGELSANGALMVGLTLIRSAGAKGAGTCCGIFECWNVFGVLVVCPNVRSCCQSVCLDGTLPGYHLHRGSGSGSNKWLIQLEVQ